MADEFVLIDVQGAPYEMGRQHGQQAAALVTGYLACIEKVTGQTRPMLCRNAERFLPMLQTLSPRFVEEVQGLSKGASISFAEALLCQVRAEASHSWDGGCTAFALKGHATADGQVLIGQNQDMEADFDDVAILLRVHPTDGRPRALMFTFAGQLGYSGINECGLAHFANSLYDFQWRPGMPHYPLKRVLLEQRTVAEAIALLGRYAVCSSGNLIIADGQGSIADLEIRPDGMTRYEDAHHDQLLHTNHYLCSEFAHLNSGWLPDTVPRLERMRDLVRAAWGSITVDVLKEFLADHDGAPAGICRHGASNLHSIAGYIAEPARRILHVRRGYGCRGTWMVYKV